MIYSGFIGIYLGFFVNYLGFIWGLFIILGFIFGSYWDLIGIYLISIWYLFVIFGFIWDYLRFIWNFGIYLIFTRIFQGFPLLRIRIDRLISILFDNLKLCYKFHLWLLIVVRDIAKRSLFTIRYVGRFHKFSLFHRSYIHFSL